MSGSQLGGKGASCVGEVTCVPQLPVLREVPDVGGVAHRCAWVMSVWCRAQVCVCGGHSCLPSAGPSSHGLLGQHLTLLSSRPSPPWPGALGKPTSVPSSTTCINITLALLPPRLFSPFPAITSQKDEGSLYNLHGHGFGGLASAGSAPQATPSPHLHASLGTSSTVQHLTQSPHPVCTSLYPVSHRDRDLCWCGSQMRPLQLAQLWQVCALCVY